METSLEQELREVQESVCEYLQRQPDADALAACAFLSRHLVALVPGHLYSLQ